MNINAPTFVPLSDAKSPSSDHTQDIKHQGKSPVERQPPRKHHNKPHGHRGKGGNRSQHHQQRSSQRTDKAQKTAPIHRAVATNDGQTLSNLTSIQSNKRGQVSLNHLLNFSFPERQAPQPVYTQRKVKSTPYQPYNKERFLNANFRFLVNPTGDYTVNLADPDLPINWADIEQVLISKSVPPTCPICLSQPTAARVTKCGHTFCLPCILHYLHLNDNPKKSWRKCPICYDAIYARDLKSVKFICVSAVLEHAVPSSFDQARITNTPSHPVAGDLVDMSLIQRSASSTLAFPISSSWPIPDNIYSAYTRPGTVFPPWHFTPDAMAFAKFMLASPEYLKSEYTRDYQELNDGLEEAKEWNATEEVQFFNSAIDIVTNELASVPSRDTPAVSSGISTAQAILQAVQKNEGKRAEMEAKKVQHTQTETQNPAYANIPEAYQQHQLSRTGSSSVLSQASDSSSPIQPVTSAKPKNNDAAPHSTSSYYFYQTADGQHVYLHPLDIKILKQEFTTYDKFPKSIVVRVNDVEESTLTEELRKKFKYLSHLPLSCDVTFLEVDLKGVVSDTTLDHFSIKSLLGELRIRQKKRNERVRREEKSKRLADSREQKQTKPSTWATHHTNAVTQDDPFFSAPLTGENTAATEEAMLSEALFASTVEDHRHKDVGPRTVWGTRAVESREPVDDLEDEYDQWGEEQIIVNKKGKKKMVLMSTSARRRL
ncbi:hypothetical protein BGW37DRAFT_269878 [Umbelopsis sp. PMI_123]|nr:hypothetical protein BGW37DRAFT_269878 [Umbelopsis sp. PMI_123]